MSLILPTSAFAAEYVDLNNYMYAHKNVPGKFLLTDSGGRTRLNADASNSNGVILSLYFDVEGLGNEQLYVTLPDGTNVPVVDRAVDLSSYRPTYVTMTLDKSGTSETWVALDRVVVDDADAVENVVYNYHSNTPTTFGSLGEGSSGGNDDISGVEVPHKFFYQDYTDYYRLDYSGEPSSTATLKLVYTSPTGVVHEKTWPKEETGGTFYLTGKGTYKLLFQDASGQTVGYIQDLDTTGIQVPVNNSFPNPFPKNDLNASMTGNACGQDQSTPNEVTWDAKEGASSYDVFKDGQKIDSTTDTKYTLPDSGSYSVVAKDSNGNVLGESDINTPYVQENSSGGTTPTVCDCIEELKPILTEIADNTSAIHLDLQETNKKLDQVNDNLKEVIRQLTPTKTYPIPNPIQTPDLYEPAEAAPSVYENNNTYFTDQGDAVTPDAMPSAPEPVPWVSEDGKTMKQDPEIQKDANMVTDPVMQSDPIMQKDQDMKLSPELIRDPELKQDAPLQVEDQNYPLRWKSSYYKP